MISSSASTTSTSASEKSENDKKKDKEDQIKPPSPKKEPAPPPPPPPAIIQPIPSIHKARSLSDDDLLEQRLSNDLARRDKNLIKSHSIPVSSDTISEGGVSDQSDQRRPEINRSYSYEDRKPKKKSSPTLNLNTSTITINSDNSSDTPSSSHLTGAVNQVTVITSHPPVIVDNSLPIPTPPPPPGFGNEIIIVSKSSSTHVTESSTDDDARSSGESSPLKVKFLDSPKGRKLDESEVLIVSPGFVDTELTIHEEDDDQEVTLDLDETEPDASGVGVSMKAHDTSHVSVITLGEDQTKVKDSSQCIDELKIVESNEDQFLHSNTTAIANGQMKQSQHRFNTERNEDVNIIVNKKISNKKSRNSPDSSGGSMESRHQSEHNSTNRSGTTPPAVVNKLDRSDVESIATTASHDSRDPDEEPVQLRRKPEPAPQKVMSPNTKKEIELANLRKKTRKRTRKFEIDGVQVTTTTSKVIYDDEENNQVYEDHIFRKQELRELKMLQKQEKKQFLELKAKELAAKEQQEKKFDQERLALERTYEADMDVLARQHRQTIEKYEQQQESELRNTSKKIRAEQERELKLV